MNENKTQVKLTIEQPQSAVHLVDCVLKEAAERGASDIHIDPRSHGTIVRLRIDGVLENFEILPRNLHEEIIARLKILAQSRTDVHAVPQDGRFEASVPQGKYNIRVSFMPTYHGENAVLRLLPNSRQNEDSFAALGFTPEHVESLSSSLTAASGLILATGPTGSGKTTTLRVCLGLKAMQPIAVMTLEDPVEYEVPGVRHVHIRETYGVSFASGLRSALRQDPDVIMVGEIRDNETAKTAIQTALTGHLVFSTLHTNSAMEAIVRLQNMSIERYLIAATLRLVINQRLVRVICKYCSGLDIQCKACRGSGYLGRSVIAEILSIDGKLQNLIAMGGGLDSLEEYANSQNFRSIHDDAREKIEWGVTTRDEVARSLAI